MIITCPNCKKQFKINQSQIPAEGRDLKCGSCEHVWFFNIEIKKTKTLPSKEEAIINKDQSITSEENIGQIIETKKYSSQNEIDEQDDKNDNKVSTKNRTKESTIGKFFSYLVVLIISFVGLIILVDTLKSPLINIFPGLENILFSLFEMLKDIKLFIIDLY